MDARCPLCGAEEEPPFFEQRGVPVHANRLAATRAEALAAPRGDLVLVACERCTLVRNRAFDSARLRYDERYETSLHASSVFRAYAAELARRLVEEHGVRDADVLEVGCGRGELLRLLCARGASRGTGVDPAHAHGREPLPGGGSVEVVARALDASWPAESADLVVARHVLEHVPEPVPFLAALRRALRPDGAAYVEVPDALWTLRAGGVLDLVYEHCTYFTAEALASALAAAGLEPVALRTGFGGQFLGADARPAEPTRAPAAPAERRAELRALRAAFGRLHREVVARWEAEARRLARSDGRLVIWGAGTKGVVLANALGEIAAAVDRVVDRNPRKQGRFVPGTGQPVVDPDALRADAPAAVLLPNPLYEGEVRAALEELGVACEVVVARPRGR